MRVKPLLSIIIVSYNIKDFIDPCFNSILADKKLDFSLNPDSELIPSELIIIDNASTDNSPARIFSYLKKHPQFSSITFLPQSKNLGFSQANNLGAKKAQGNYLLFLNPDTIILHSAISQTLEWLSSHPEAACATAQLLNFDKSIQPSGGFFPNLKNLTTWSLNLDDLPLVNNIIGPIHPHSPTFGLLPSNFYLKDHPQDWITGAFMLWRRYAFESIGGFDPKYFMYGEELELFYRLRLTHPELSVWYLIGPQIIHLGGGSAVAKFHPLLSEYKGILAFFKKHRPTHLPIAKFLIKINCLTHLWAYRLIGRFNTASLYSQTLHQL
jgi:GT2 family glycosyltransferase